MEEAEIEGKEHFLLEVKIKHLALVIKKSHTN